MMTGNVFQPQGKSVFMPVPVVILRGVLCVCLLLLPALSPAQCPPPTPNASPVDRFPAPAKKPAREEPILPEAGFLSDTHYTSQFFGFGFDLPLTVHGHEVMLPVMPEKQHALLALQYEEGKHRGYIEVTAYDPVKGFDANTPEQQEQELREWSKQGTRAGQLPQMEIPKYMMRNHGFYHRNLRLGKFRAVEYWAGINNYTVKVVAASTDGEFVRKMKDLMEQAEIYCPTDDGTLTDDRGKAVTVHGMPYTGPTAPTFRVNAALRDTPAQEIPMGEVADGVYRNSDLGLEYVLPLGWAKQAPAAADPPVDEAALREYRFLHACSVTLLQSAAREKGADSGVVLRALDPNCLSMRTPASLTDKRALDEMAASFERLGEFGKINSDELMTISGRLFMVFHGTIPASSHKAGLPERLSQTIFVTRYNKLLMMWSFTAADIRALDELPTGDIRFASSPAIHLQLARRKDATLTANGSDKP